MHRKLPNVLNDEKNMAIYEYAVFVLINYIPFFFLNLSSFFIKRCNILICIYNSTKIIICFKKKNIDLNYNTLTNQI